MAQSRYGSAGELLAWRPDRVGLFFGKHIYRLRTPLTANDPELVHRPRAGPDRVGHEAL